MTIKITRSLGGLRPNTFRNSIQAPEFLGRLLFTRETLKAINADAQTNPQDFIEVSLAGWKNTSFHRGKSDHYLTIEIRSLSNKNDRWYRTNADQEPITSLEQFFQ